jgi:hypothetical protein
MVNALVIRRNAQLALRAAQYVRMSTDYQRYSIQNQTARAVGRLRRPGQPS